MRFDDLPDEQAVGIHHARVTQTAFEIRVALRDQGRRHLGRPLRGQAKPLEFVDVAAMAILSPIATVRTSSDSDPPGEREA